MIYIKWKFEIISIGFSKCQKWDTKKRPFILVSPGEKVPSSIRRMNRFRSSCARAKSRSCIWPLFEHYLVSNDPVSCLRTVMLWSDYADAQADLGFRWPICPKTRFCMARPIPGNFEICYLIPLISSHEKKKKKRKRKHNGLMCLYIM